MMSSTGAEMPTGHVSAHKRFNHAAMRGKVQAIRLRREITMKMTEAEIARALRAARDWLKHWRWKVGGCRPASAAPGSGSGSWVDSRSYGRSAPGRPLASSASLGHMGSHGDVAEWLKAAVC